MDAHDGESTYAGFPLCELGEEPSNQGFITGPESLEQRVLPGYAFDLLDLDGIPPLFEDGLQPTQFESRRILEEAEAGHRTLWDGCDAQVRAGNRIPIPSAEFDPSDPELRDAAAASLQGHIADSVSDDNLADVRELFDEQTQRELSFIPSADEAAPELFGHFCARCHNSRLDQTLSRARFNVDTLDALDDAGRDVVVQRLMLLGVRGLRVALTASPSHSSLAPLHQSPDPEREHSRFSCARALLNGGGVGDSCTRPTECAPGLTCVAQAEAPACNDGRCCAPV